MKNTEEERNRDDLLCSILKKSDIPLSRAAIFIMLDDGMLTEETSLDYYLVARNLYTLLSNYGCVETLTETRVTEYLEYGLTDKEIGKRVAKNYLSEGRKGW